MPPDLPSDYYLTNFVTLLDYVADNYRTVLVPEELRFREEFHALPHPAKCLYVRLLCRKPVYFRLNRLSYPEIEDPGSAARALAQAGQLEIGSAAAHEFPVDEELLSLFTVAELKKWLELRSAGRRELVVASILQMPATEVWQRLVEHDTILQLRRRSLFELYLLCFFGNRHQDLTEFVLRDLGLARYEQYTIRAENRVFGSREQLAAHQQYYQCLDRVDEDCLASADSIMAVALALPEADDSDPVLLRRTGRLRNQLARQLERLTAWQQALTLYRGSPLPPSRERQARILDRLGESDAALALCAQMRSAPRTEQEQAFSVRFGAGVARRLAPGRQGRRDSGSSSADADTAALANRWPLPERYDPPTDILDIHDTGAKVEIQAADRIGGTAGNCEFVENNLFPAWFALAYWEVIYADIPGVFFNPFQSAPADFHQYQFTLARQSLLEGLQQRLRQEGALKALILRNGRSKEGIMNPLINWQRLSSLDWQRWLAIVPEQHLRAIFLRLLRDIRHNSSGFPDLFHACEHGYELVEVKGPGDTLQQNQRRWLAWFAEHGIPHRVVNVRWRDPVG